MSRQPVNCPYFYGDYHRGRNVEECRLLGPNRDNPITWRRRHCDSCPVPDTVASSNSPDLMIDAVIVRRFLRERVEIRLVACARHMVELSDPSYCPECAKEQDALLSQL